MSIRMPVKPEVVVCAGDPMIGIAVVAARRVASGCCYVHVRARVGVISVLVLVACSGHGQHVVVGGWVGRAVPFIILIADSSHQQSALVIGIVYCAPQGRRAGSTAYAEVNDVRPVVGGPPDAAGNIAGSADTQPTQYLDWHDPRSPGDACHAFSVVADCSGDASHMGAVSCIIRWVTVMVDEIVAGDNLVGQVGVREIHATVHNGDGDAGGAGGDVPSALSANLAHVPLVLGVVAVVGGNEGLVDVVWFGVKQPRVSLQLLDQGQFLSLRHGQNLDTNLLNPANNDQAVLIEQSAGGVHFHPVLEAHQDTAGRESGPSPCPPERHDSDLLRQRRLGGRRRAGNQSEDDQRKQDGECVHADVTMPFHARTPLRSWRTMSRSGTALLLTSQRWAPALGKPLEQKTIRAS